MGESARHKECKRRFKEMLSETHSCRTEVPLWRRIWNRIDVECYPDGLQNEQNWLPVAAEFENESSKLQRESNWKDLLAWKKKNPEGKIFQVEDPEEIDINELKRKPDKLDWRRLRR